MPIKPVSGEIKSQVINDNFSLLDSKTNNINKGAPSGTYATLTELQTAYPNGHNNIYVVTADGKWYYWSGTDWVAGGLYQEKGLADNSVTRPKMTIFEKAFEDQVINGMWEEGFYYKYSTGAKVTRADYGCLTIQLKANTTYNLIGTRNGDGRHTSYWDSSGTYKSGSNGTVITVAENTEVRIGLRIDEKAGVSVVESSQSYLFNDPQSFSTTANMANLGSTNGVNWYVSDRSANKKNVLLLTESDCVVNPELLLSTANVALTANGKRFSIKFSDMSVDTNTLNYTSNNHKWIFFNPFNKTFYVGSFSEALGKNINIQNSIFLGIIYYSDEAMIIRQSTNLISINYRGYQYPAMGTSDLASRMQLPTARITCFSNAGVKPVIDFVSRKIILLKGQSYIVDLDGSYVWWGGASGALTEDYVLDIGSEFNTAYVFVAIESTGPRLFLKGAQELTSTWAVNEYYLGYITMNSQTTNIQFPIDVIRTKGSSTVLKISFLGDSITTFKGYIPLGTGHYPSGDVTSVNNTWWMRMINQTGGKLQLLLNNSRSGSQMADYGDQQLEGDAGVYRCENLAKDGVSPDIIEIRIGVNDYNRGIPMGDYDVTSQEPATDVTTFASAYCMALDKMTALYPNARIIMHTLFFNNYGGFPRVREDGLTLADFNEKIRQIAKRYNCDLVDEEKANFNQANVLLLTEEGNHPNAAGMIRIYEQAYDVVKKYLTGGD